MQEGSTASSSLVKMQQLPWQGSEDGDKGSLWACGHQGLELVLEDLEGICRNMSGHRERVAEVGDDLPHAIALIPLLKLS